MSPSVTINRVLEEIEQLDLDDRIYLHEVLSSRLIETKRARIADRVREAEQNYAEGNVRSGSVDDLLGELND